MTTFRPLALTLAASLSTAASQAADGNDPPALANQTAWLRLGAVHANVDSTVRVDNANASFAGTTADLERDLGLPSRKTLPTVSLGARFASDWRVGFDFFRLDRSGTQAQSTPLVIGGTTFPATSTVTGKVDAAVYRADLAYAFVHTPQNELGVLAGVHVTTFDIDVRGNVALAGQPVQTQSEVKKATVPLPIIGLYGSTALAPGLALNGRLDGMKASRNGDNARLVGAQLGLSYRFNQNLGLGLNYRYEDYRVGSVRSSFRGNLAYQLHGPQAYVELGF